MKNKINIQQLSKAFTYADWDFTYSHNKQGAQQAADWLADQEASEEFIAEIIERFGDEVVEAFEAETQDDLNEFAIVYLQDIIASELLRDYKGQINGSVAFNIN